MISYYSSLQRLSSVPLPRTRRVRSAIKLCTAHSVSSALPINHNNIIFFYKTILEDQESNPRLLVRSKNAYPLRYAPTLTTFLKDIRPGIEGLVLRDSSHSWLQALSATHGPVAPRTLHPEDGAAVLGIGIGLFRSLDIVYCVSIFHFPVTTFSH